MKTIIKFILALAFLLNVGAVNAQSTDMNYALESGTVTISGINSPIFSTLNKVGAQMAWKQQFEDNESTTVFDISATTGNWDQNTNTGSLSHTVYMEGMHGVFSLEGTESGITMSLSITDDETQQQFLYTIFINTITYQ